MILKLAVHLRLGPQGIKQLPGRSGLYTFPAPTATRRRGTCSKLNRGLPISLSETNKITSYRSTVFESQGEPLEGGPEAFA